MKDDALDVKIKAYFAKEEEVVDSLNKLGTTRNEIRKALVKSKVKGTPKNVDDCVVCQYLNKLKLDGVTNFFINGKKLNFTTDKWNHTLDLSDQVTEFVTAFDNGEYEELQRTTNKAVLDLKAVSELEVDDEEEIDFTSKKYRTYETYEECQERRKKEQEKATTVTTNNAISNIVTTETNDATVTNLNWE